MPARFASTVHLPRLSLETVALLAAGLTFAQIKLGAVADAAELASGSLSISRSVRFSDIDTDRNGAISRMEAHQFPRLEREFPLVDGNADGWVTRDEFEVFSPTPQQDSHS